MEVAAPKMSCRCGVKHEDRQACMAVLLRKAPRGVMHGAQEESSPPT